MSTQHSHIEDAVPSDDVPSLKPSIKGHTLTPMPGAPSRTPQTSPLRQSLTTEIADDDPKLFALFQAARRQLIQNRANRASTIADNAPATDRDLGRARFPSNATPDDPSRDSSSNGDVRASPQSSKPRSKRDKNKPVRLTPTPRIESVTPVLRINARFPDPPLFDNGEDPTFDSWIIDLDSKLEASGYMDASVSEKQRMNYALSRTTSEARAQLLTRFPTTLRRVHHTFRTLEEMIQSLATAYVNPFESLKKQDEYRSLCMTDTETVRQFKIRFLTLSAQAGTSRDQLFSDFRAKLTPRIRTAIASQVYSMHQSFTTLCAVAEQTDLKLSHIA